MTVILDAIGAVEIALENSQSKEFMGHLNEANVIIAPDTFVSELTNVFWKYRKFSNFTDEICVKGIEFCINLVDDYIDSKELWREAYSEGIRNQSSVCDMFHLLTARRNGGKLISVDKRLNQIAEKEGLRI